MQLTNDQKAKMLVGEYVFQIITLETRLAEEIAKNEKLEADLAKLQPVPVEPKHE